ncbi:CBS domain-containing protein CBSX1, chloroplastic [Glycine max]|nr:CBS domain-containing protein CBSX1, chloroplastic [Glycine max]
MSSIHLLNTLAVPLRSFSPPSLFPQCHSPLRSSSAVPKRRRFSNSSGFRLASSQTVNSVPRANGTYTVSDFMTKKQDLHVVKTTTTVDEALEALVNNRISGLPVIDEDWNLVGVVSDYDLLAIDSISGGPQSDANLFPDVDSTWKTFNELQKLLSKTNGQVVGDLMTPTPLVVHESTSLEEAARLLLETKYRRLPVVDDDGKLVGLITRGNIVKAALLSKRAGEWPKEELKATFDGLVRS